MDGKRIIFDLSKTSKKIIVLIVLFLFTAFFYKKQIDEFALLSKNQSISYYRVYKPLSLEEISVSKIDIESLLRNIKCKKMIIRPADIGVLTDYEYEIHVHIKDKNKMNQWIIMIGKLSYCYNPQCNAIKYIIIFPDTF